MQEAGRTNFAHDTHETHKYMIRISGYSYTSPAFSGIFPACGVRTTRMFCAGRGPYV